MNTPLSHEKVDARFTPVHHSSTFNRILDALDLRTKKVLDLGCGYGEYLVNFGPESLGVTSTVEEVDYGKAKGIRIVKGNVEQLETLALNEQFEAVWANNLFEHLLAPHAFLMHLKTLAKQDTLLVLGVPVVPRIVSLMKLVKFRGALADPHINFFTKETLRLTVERTGWKVKGLRPFVFQNAFLDKLFSCLAPHLYVVAYNDTNFAYPEKKLKEWENEPHYAEILSLGNRR